MFADSWLPLPLCVSSNYTGTYGRGREGDESAVKPGHEQSQKQREGANAWTPRHDRQPLGLFYSAARSFLGFVLSALPSHPPTRPPLWMVLQMICVQFGFTRANTASKSRHTLPASLQSACLSCVWELLNLFSACGFVRVWVKGHFRLCDSKMISNMFYHLQFDLFVWIFLFSQGGLTYEKSFLAWTCLACRSPWMKEPATVGGTRWRRQNHQQFPSFSHIINHFTLFFLQWRSFSSLANKVDLCTSWIFLINSSCLL